MVGYGASIWDLLRALRTVLSTYLPPQNYPQLRNMVPGIMQRNYSRNQVNKEIHVT
jgi:hypothetical protein